MMSGSRATLVLSLSVTASLGMECPPATPPDLEPVYTVSFANDIQPIFNTHCTRCHVTGGFANNSGIPLKLIEGVSYNLLIGRQSVNNPNWTLVAPGDPDNSLLYHKMSSTMPPVGRRMPWDGATTLSQDEIDHVRTWIAEGAVNN